MCNLPRSREDRIAIHSDHSQRRPHCHSWRSASPTSESHLHLEPSPSSRPLGFNHHTPWLTSAEPALAMIRRSHPWFTPQTLQIRIWFHLQRAPHVLKLAHPQTNRIVRTAYTASLSQDATQNGATHAEKNRTSRSYESGNESKRRGTSEFERLCVRYHPHKFPRQTGLGLHSTPSPSLNVRVSPP